MAEKQFRPMKAVSEPLSFEDVAYPKVASIKMDGVYALNRGGLLGRSLKPLKNKKLTNTLSHIIFSGIVGEITHVDWDDENLGFNRESLCRESTSFTNTVKNEDDRFVWCLFDYLGDDGNKLVDKPYHVRMNELLHHLVCVGEEVALHNFCGIEYIEMMAHGVSMIIPECKLVHSAEEAEALYNLAIEEGYEGIVLRDPDAGFKFGRSTKRTQEFVRMKPSDDSEIIITHFEEMQQNQNEAKVNELGYTERSSHKENKVGLGKVGALVGIDINTGDTIKVGAGKLTHDMRQEIWENQDSYIGKLSKYRYMATGIKDKPRHPRHIMFRPVTDVEISSEILDKVKSLGITLK